MAYYLKFRNYVLLLFVFEFYRFSESRSMGTFDSVQLGDILRQTDLTSMAGNVNRRDDDVEWPNYTDNGDLKIDLSLNQLVNLMRKLKSQNKIDRQDRIKNKYATFKNCANVKLCSVFDFLSQFIFRSIEQLLLLFNIKIKPFLNTIAYFDELCSFI